METVVVTFEGRQLEFNLDHERRKWTPVEASTLALLSESEFPLIANASGKRYEIYSDGTFAEVEK
ncbi:MAG: hypothetical protein WB757_03205 [Candidatus Cybelea sp.]|jgi:hypothetical protein